MPERPMRLLLITNMYPPHHLGGYELSCQDVVERFRARGHEVTVLTTSFRRSGVHAVDESPDRVRRTLDFYWRDDEPWTPGRRAVMALERHDQRELRAALHEVDPDVVSIWNMGAVPLSLLATLIRSKRPLVYHVCNEWPAINLQHDAFRAVLVRHPLLARVGATAGRVPTELPDLGPSGSFCWVSQSTWDDAERSTPWRFADSVVVHSGISHVDFPLVDPPAAAKPWRGRLLYVGRIEGQKSVFTIVEALPLLDGMTVELVGPSDPKYLAGVMLLADDLGVRDRISTTVVSRDELRKRYIDADAVLFTSRAEPFGLVPIEAMACATPVVASGAGGSSEFLVDGVNCVRYPAGEAAGLAAAVRRLQGAPDLRRALAVQGLATAAEFSVDRLADRLEQAHATAAARDGRL